MEVSYTKQGDYLLPNLVLENKNLGEVWKYGLVRLRYLKMHKKGLYQTLMATNTLTEHLIEIDEAATTRVEQLINSLPEEMGADEELKATDQMRWVSIMNNAKCIAEEIAFKELIYL